jgi:uncharacterized membrane protein YeaQ/YmgE (transglycosylase-associated protein family)
MGMLNMGKPFDSRRRLFLSVVYAIAMVFASTVIVVMLSGSHSPDRGLGLQASEIVTDVLAVPLATGALVVKLVFGEWRSVHGGQIALVPFISVVIDAFLIFVIWEFLHRKKARELVSDVPHIYR